jgi:hypothetical protein
MRPSLASLTLALAACAPAPFDADDTDTDGAETDDTEPPPDVDASGWEVDPGVAQRFEAKLVAESPTGETQERDVDFGGTPDAISHAVVPFEGVNFRNVVGAVQANVPVGGGVQVLTRFEMRLVLPEDVPDTGTFDCRGSDLYGVTLAIAAVSDEAAGALSFSSTRLDPVDDTRPCSITLTRYTLQRVTAEIDVAWMLSNAKNDQGENLVGRVEDMVVDVSLREAEVVAE